MAKIQQNTGINSIVKYFILLIIITAGLAASEIKAQAGDMNDTAKVSMTEMDYLKSILYTRQEIDDWLAGKAFEFAYYDEKLGWLLNNAQFRDGLDNSISTYTYASDKGERKLTNYAEKPCRINTYGDSYTQCHQVSDHETWQEVLAAHIQEPIRNFGIGAWSVYQAYLRMLKEEERKPAEYIIFNIYVDDHYRNLDAWRNIRVRKHPAFIEPTLPYLKVDLSNEKIIECANPCPDRESLYALCDPDKTYSLFKDDFVLKIMLAHANSKTKNPSKSYADIMSLTKTHGIETRVDDNATLALAAEELHNKASLFATEWIVGQIENYAASRNKKVLYILSYPAASIAEYIEEGKRWDQPFVDFLKEKNLPFVDLAEEHRQDYANYKIGIKDYLSQYFVGHYNPRGNFFCAFAIKNAVVSMLNPKPVPYK